jgi:PAS domain S-box-containing protein
VSLPQALLKKFEQSSACAPYLVSCFGRPSVLYVSPQFKRLTGYEADRFKNEGLPFWFSVIHPADITSVVDRIKKAEHALMVGVSAPRVPLELEYRIKRADGRLAWLRELKLILTYRDGVKDHILCAFHEISAEKERETSDIQHLVQTEPKVHGLLETALSYQSKQSGGARSLNEAAPKLSPREDEVLRLVATGSSSKQIAADLSISENTVETHRRNLLKKFKVNNSAALLTEARRLAVI